MDDAVGWVLALGITFFTFRYFFSSESSAAASGPGGRRRRVVTQAQVDQVRAVFPNVSEGAVRYELERTGNVETTVEKCLSQGGLPEPPAGFFADPAPPTPPAPAAAAPRTPARSSTSATTQGTPPSLIKRLNLQSQVGVSSSPLAEGKGKGKEVVVGKAAWETSSEAREKSLKERKERMVLEARRKLLEKERERKEAAESS